MMAITEAQVKEQNGNNFIKAVVAGARDEVEAIFAEGNFPPEALMKAVEKAAFHDHLEILDYLLTQDKVVVTSAAKGDALVFAAQKGFERIIDRLLQEKNIQRVDLRRASMTAKDHGANPACKRIYEKLENFDYRVMAQNCDAPRLVITEEDQRQENGQLLIRAVEQGDFDQAQKIFEELPIDPQRFQEAVSMAGLYGRLTILEYFLAQKKMKVMPDTKGEALVFAAQGARKDVVLRLLQDEDVTRLHRLHACRAAQNHGMVIPGAAEIFVLLCEYDGIELPKAPERPKSHSKEEEKVERLLEAAFGQVLQAQEETAEQKALNAIKTGDWLALHEVLERATPDLVNKALPCAVKYDRQIFLRDLLARPEVREDGVKEALNASIRYRRDKIFDELYERREITQEVGKDALADAVHCDYRYAFDKLLRHPALTQDAVSFALVMAAFSEKHLSMMRVLLARKEIDERAILESLYSIARDEAPPPDIKIEKPSPKVIRMLARDKRLSISCLQDMLAKGQRFVGKPLFLDIFREELARKETRAARWKKAVSIMKIFDPRQRTRNGPGA